VEIPLFVDNYIRVDLNGLDTASLAALWANYLAHNWPAAGETRQKCMQNGALAFQQCRSKNAPATKIDCAVPGVGPPPTYQPIYGPIPPPGHGHAYNFVIF